MKHFPLLVLIVTTLASAPAQADVIAGWGQKAPGITVIDAGQACRGAVSAAGRAAGVPDHLMSAIARVESGRRGADGQVNPWPWSINAEGIDHVFETREAAIAAVRLLQSQGMRSIDVGCMQINLMHHPGAFASLEQAFDPSLNAAYAAHFLSELFQQTGSWTKATAAYHSATPELGDAYQRKVAAVLAEESQKDVAALGQSPGAQSPGAQSPGDIPHASGLAAMPPGSGALMLGNRSNMARIIPLAGAGMARGLDAYRAAPVRIAASGR